MVKYGISVNVSPDQGYIDPVMGTPRLSLRRHPCRLPDGNILDPDSGQPHMYCVVSYIQRFVSREFVMCRTSPNFGHEGATSARPASRHLLESVCPSFSLLQRASTRRVGHDTFFSCGPPCWSALGGRLLIQLALNTVCHASNMHTDVMGVECLKARYGTNVAEEGKGEKATRHNAAAAQSPTGPNTRVPRPNVVL